MVASESFTYEGKLVFIKIYSRPCNVGKNKYIIFQFVYSNIMLRLLIIVICFSELAGSAERSKRDDASFSSNFGGTIVQSSNNGSSSGQKNSSTTGQSDDQQLSPCEIAQNKKFNMTSSLKN